MVSPFGRRMSADSLGSSLSSRQLLKNGREGGGRGGGGGSRRKLGICHQQQAIGGTHHPHPWRKLTPDIRAALLGRWLRDLDAAAPSVSTASPTPPPPLTTGWANNADAAIANSSTERLNEGQHTGKVKEAISKLEDAEEGKKPVEVAKNSCSREFTRPNECSTSAREGGEVPLTKASKNPQQCATHREAAKATTAAVQLPSLNGEVERRASCQLLVEPSAPPLSVVPSGPQSNSSSGSSSRSTSQISAPPGPRLHRQEGGGKALNLNNDIEECCKAEANNNNNKKLRWIDNTNAKKSVMIALSFFYAMLATIFALVFELSHIITGDTRNRRSLGLKELIFGVYMYGYSIGFLLYCYIGLLLNPRWKRRIGTIVRFQNGSRTDSSQNIVQQEERKVSHNSPSAGSLFLRLGCVVFGVIGTVYYAFDVFLCISDNSCNQYYLICLDLLAIVFVFTQMHFVFCNWKLTISQDQMVCRFGTMHLVATNLWIWIRYILIEESLMGDEIRQVFARHAPPQLLNSTKIGGTTTMLPTTPPPATMNYWPSTTKSAADDGISSFGSSSQFPAQHVTVNPAGLGIMMMADSSVLASALNKRSSMRRCQGAECVLASFNEVMYTSIVEYSLIGAAVMFIVWRNIGKIENPMAKIYVPRKHRIRMDCSKSTTGLFFGLAFLAGTFTSMAVFSGYTIMGQNHMAATLFGFTDIIHYLISTCGCVVALWRMRLLRFHQHQSFPMEHHHHNHRHNESALDNSNNSRRASSTKTGITFASSTGILASTASSSSSSCNSSSNSSCSSANGLQNNSQELLDMILLAFGMTGEMIYSVAGLLGLTGDPNWQPLTIILLAVHITRILEVGLQSCLIYIAGKLRVGNDPLLRETQPGKQAITFLLLANISMFLMNLLEAEKAGVSETVVNFYGKRSWVFLVRSFSPLAIFYRFHSSVCLAEVWKSTYSWKE